MNKLERALFYPVLVISTLLAFGSWSMPEVWISAPCTLVVAFLWIHPVFKGRFAFSVRAVFWLAFGAVLLSAVWTLLLSGLLIPG